MADHVIGLVVTNVTIVLIVRNGPSCNDRPVLRLPPLSKNIITLVSLAIDDDLMDETVGQGEWNKTETYKDAQRQVKITHDEEEQRNARRARARKKTMSDYRSEERCKTQRRREKEDCYDTTTV